MHQEMEREKPAKLLNQYKNAIFDNVVVRKYFVKTDGICYPKDPLEII